MNDITCANVVTTACVAVILGNVIDGLAETPISDEVKQEQIAKAIMNPKEGAGE